MLQMFKAAVKDGPGWLTDVTMRELRPDFMKAVLEAVKASSLRFAPCRASN
jgi:hypothetical protein